MLLCPFTLASSHQSQTPGENEAQRTNKPALLSDVAGPVGYSLEMKGLVPRFGPQYL